MERRELTMNVGEQSSISSDGVKSYSEGVPGIVDVRLPTDGSRFILVAMKAGTTTLLLIMDDGKQIQYTIRVGATGVKDGDTIQAVDNIRLDFYFVQLTESYNHQLGVGWPGTIGGSFNLSASYDLVSGSFQNATAVIANQALPRLDIAQANGWARIMRQAAVITANGREASFNSGGEVNIPVQGALTAEIRKIEFGSNVQVLPRYDAQSGRIELTLRANLSELTNASGAGIPGRSKSELQTQVNIELGQSLILAGLSAKSQSNEQAGLPGFSQIPILGLLFGSNNKRSEHTENLIFIVPTVVDVISQQSRDLVAEAIQVYDDYSGDLDDIHLIQKPQRGGIPRR